MTRESKGRMENLEAQDAQELAAREAEAVAGGKRSEEWLPEPAGGSKPGGAIGS